MPRKSAVKVEWSPDTVVKYIMMCRRDKGLPVFVTKMFGTPLEHTVVMRCWGGEGKAPDTVIFENAPQDIVEELRRRRDDWIWLLEKYGTRKQLEEAINYPVLLKRTGKIRYLKYLVK